MHHHYPPKTEYDETMSTTQQKTDAEILKENIQATTELETAAAEVCTENLRYILRKTLDDLEPRSVMTDAIPIEREYHSLGYCCQIFGLSPDLIRELARRANVTFSHSTDAVPYYGGREVLTMLRLSQKLLAEEANQE